MVRTTMTVIRKREINLYGGRCWLGATRQGQARISRFDARFTAAALVYSPTCSLFSLLSSLLQNGARCARFVPTNEGPPRILGATSTALPYANQIKVALESIYTAAFHGDFEESVWIQRDRGEPASRVTTTAGALWMAAVLESFREGLSFLWNLCSSSICVGEIISERRTFASYSRITVVRRAWS